MVALGKTTLTARGMTARMIGYARKYWHWAFLAVLTMGFEVWADLMIPSVMSRLVDDGILGQAGGGPDAGAIARYGLIMAAVAAAGAVAGVLNNLFVNLTGQNIGNDIRKSAFSRIMQMTFPQIEGYTTGSLITRMTNDVSQVQRMVGNIVRGCVKTALLLAGSIWFVFQLDRQFGLIVLAAAPLMLLGMILCVSKVVPLFPKLQSELDRVNAILQEDTDAIRVIKSCVREIHEIARFGSASDALIAIQLRILTIFACIGPIMNLILAAVVTGMLYVGFSDALAGHGSPGSVMAGINRRTEYTIKDGKLTAQRQYLIDKKAYIVNSIFDNENKLHCGYVTGQRNRGKACLGSAQFLCYGSMSYTNALEPVSANSMHPSYKGKKVIK